MAKRSTLDGFVGEGTIYCTHTLLYCKHVYTTETSTVVSVTVPSIAPTHKRVYMTESATVASVAVPSIAPTYYCCKCVCIHDWGCHSVVSSSVIYCTHTLLYCKLVYTTGAATVVSVAVPSIAPTHYCTANMYTYTTEATTVASVAAPSIASTHYSRPTKGVKFQRCVQYRCSTYIQRVQNSKGTCSTGLVACYCIVSVFC